VRAEVTRGLKRALRTGADTKRPEEPARLEPGEAEAEAEQAVEILGQDTGVRRKTAPWSATRWRRLCRCFHRYVDAKLQALAKRRFRSAADLDVAVAKAVLDAVAEVAKDPEAFERKRCRRSQGRVRK
jgi:hypothetical protein